jgi:hypothetical protein
VIEVAADDDSAYEAVVANDALVALPVSDPVIPAVTINEPVMVVEPLTCNFGLPAVMVGVLPMPI